MPARRALCVLGLLCALLGAASCPADCICGDDISCPLPDGTELTIEAVPSQYATIKCGGAALPCERVPRVPSVAGRPVHTLQLMDCSPPDTLACVPAALGVTDVQAVDLHYTPGGPAALPATLFSGLNISELILVEDSFPANAGDPVPFPPAVYSVASNLRRLKLQRVKLQLKPDTFIGLENLLKLEVSMAKIERWPPGAFRPLRNLTFLSMFGNSFADLVADSFEGLEALELLDLSSNRIERLQTGLLTNLKHLKILALYGNPISLVEGDALPASLEELKLHDCGSIVELRGRALSLPTLKTLHMWSCGLTALPADVFAGVTSLREALLHSNNLTSLPDQLFRDAVVLQKLDVSHNSLRNLSRETFRYLVSLTRLNLDYNMLEELPDLVFADLRLVEQISLNHNRLRWIADDAFQRLPALRRLELGDNRLHALDPVRERLFQPLDQLAELLLPGNQLHEVDGNWRLGMTQLALLDLSRNNFTYLQSSDVDFIQLNITVDFRRNNISRVSLPPTATAARLLLDDNPFTCDCQLVELVNKLQGAVTGGPEISAPNASCAEPKELSSLRLTSISPRQLTCPLSASACPPTCSCLSRLAEKQLELRCHRQPEESQFPEPRDHGLEVSVLQLETVGKTIGRLPSHVVSLSLAGLQLTELPSIPLDTIVTLRVVDLRNNRLSAVPEVLVATNVSLLLQGNPLLCDCEHVNSVTTLQDNSRLVRDYSSLRCFKGNNVSAILAQTLCPSQVPLYAGAAVGVLAALVLAVSLLVIRYSHDLKVFLYSRGWCLRWVQEEDLDKDKEYDAFVSFAHADEAFVVDELIPRLEDMGYRICVHYRDWTVGEMITAQIARSVERSRRTVVVLSEHFVRSEWAREEFGAAHAAALREGRARVIVLLLGERPPAAALAHTALRSYLSTNTYLRRDDTAFWRRLAFAMPHGARRPHRAHSPCPLQLTNPKLFHDLAPDKRLPLSPEILQNKLIEMCS